MRLRSSNILASLSVFMLLLGCGGSNNDMVHVTGQLTYGGGEWPAAGIITLTPISTPAGGPSRPGSSNFNVDGEFAIGSYKPGDGLRPGTYNISVSCYDPAKMGQGKRPAEMEFVPADFKHESLVIEPGQDDIVLNIDVPKKQ
jgi:hypothetical protein